MYEIWNPAMTTVIRTKDMGEADFWSALGYTVIDHYYCTFVG